MKDSSLHCHQYSCTKPWVMEKHLELKHQFCIRLWLKTQSGQAEGHRGTGGAAGLLLPSISTWWFMETKPGSHLIVGGEALLFKPHLRLTHTLTAPLNLCPCPELRLQLSPPSLPFLPTLWSTQHCNPNHRGHPAGTTAMTQLMICVSLAEIPRHPQILSQVVPLSRDCCQERHNCPPSSFPPNSCLPLPASSSICVVKCAKQLFFLFFCKSWVFSGSAS